MKAICKINIDQGEQFQSLAQFGPIELQIEIGKEYFIMGIAMWRNTLMYLIDENMKPDWYSANLFEVSDNKIPYPWFFKNFSKGEVPNVEFFCGYHELCLEENHYDKLLDRNEQALKIYFDRKEELIKKSS